MNLDITLAQHTGLEKLKKMANHQDNLMLMDTGLMEILMETLKIVLIGEL